LSALDRLRAAGRRLRRSQRPWRALRERPAPVVAFSPPDYLGVTRSTQSFFERWIPLAEHDLVRARDRRELVHTLSATGVETAVFSGFARGYARVIEALHRARPGVRVLVLWHGSPLQHAEDCSWRHLQEVLALHARGCVHAIGCFKQGFPELLARAGARALAVSNRASAPAERPGAVPTDGRVHLGVWSAGPSWRKNPFAMVSAAALVEGAVLSGVLDERARTWARQLGVELGRTSRAPFPAAELCELLAAQHCNLYVTLSECSPLLPVESLALGAPCLVSPTSHLFREPTPAARLLHRRLVVERFEDAAAIADAAREAAAHRKEIGEAYREWAPAQDRAAREAMEELLRCPIAGPTRP